MPLENFGSILNFAEEIEKQDQSFFSAAAENPACVEYRPLLVQFAADAEKNIKAVQRARRENVTEMILEPIRDFSRGPFHAPREAADGMGAATTLDTARRRVDRALRYYTAAAAKIKALPEVSRALKTIGKKHAAHQEQLAAVKLA